MDKIVADANVLIKWFVDEEDTDKAQVLLDQIAAGIYTLILPDLVYAEVGNIIWKKVNRKEIVPADAQLIVDSFFAADLEMEIVPARTLFIDSFRLAVTYQRSMYDSMYLALSLRERCQMVTADERLVNIVGPKFPNLILLSNWS
jgi:predicted nucleic acid-binding protein